MFLSVSLECYKCQTVANAEIVYKEWLEPVYIRDRDGWLQTQLCPQCARWNLRYLIKVKYKLRIGRISNLLLPGYSACHKCHTNWGFATYHQTSYGDGGCFPLCEMCWAELTPEQRLPYYEQLYKEWQNQGSRCNAAEWLTIKTAVLEGK